MAKQTVLKVYKSYNFVDKDPVIDKLRTVIAQEGESYTHLQKTSGVSTTTMYGWFNGRTKRPQFATVMAVFRAMGYDLQVAERSRGANSVTVVSTRITR